MLNFRKVENYTRARLEKYRPYYPAEIFEGLKVSASSGNFGVCLLSIERETNPHNLNEISTRYVSRYNDIDGLISDFVTRGYELIAGRYYENHRKEQEKGMTCRLEIFNDSHKVNEFNYTECEQVKNELIKILIADKRRGTRTTYKPIPYSNDMTIIQKWSREEAHTTTNIKYIYHFKNISY